MKKLKLFFALFAMLALGVTNAWGQTTVYTETFEDASYKTSTTYNNSTEKKHGPTNYQWGVLCGTPNTGAHNGSKAFAMRYYKSVAKTPTLTQYFDINSVDRITFWAKTESTNNKLNVEYSTNGGSSWSSLASNISVTTSYKEYTYDFPTQQSAVRLRFTMGTTTEKKSMFIDDVAFIKVSSGSEPETPVASLSADPTTIDFGTKNIYFDSEKQGSLEIEITGQNLTGDVTAAISGTDASVFTTSKTTFTPNSGEVSEKLSVSYSVSEVKDYEATLTLSSDGVEAIELPITLTTINKKPTIYTKVTDAATLSAGDKVIFVYETGKVAAGALSSGYLTSIDVAQAINTTANPATVSITDEAVIEYTLGGTIGAWEFISASGKLSEASANSTKSVDLAYNKGTTWTIVISSGNATIKGTTNTIQYNEANPRFKTYTSGQKTIQLYAISVPKYAVNFIQPEGGELIVKNGETAITSGDTFAEGIKLTVTATPANGYEGGTVVVEDADGNDVTATVYADGVLTMPAYAVTISATFEKKECTLLTTPTVSATTTYNSATLTWNAVDNAAKYSVKVGAAEAVEMSETSYDVTGLAAETTYTYQVQAIAEADQDTYCDSEAAEGSFTTSAAPVVTLTLKDIAGITTKKGALNSTITLPTEAAECSKTFVGWDADENCKQAPTYAKGAEYTLAEDQTLYAVYADGEGGGNFTITKTMSEIVSDNGYTVSSGTTAICYTSLTLDENITLSTTGSANCGSFWSDPREWRLYQNKSGNAIVTATNGCSLTSVKFTFTYSNTGTLLNNGASMTSGTAVSASGTSATYTVGNSGSATNGQIRITAIEVSYSKEGEYSNYSTTCAAAPTAEVDPTPVTATAAETTGKLTVTYDNVNTEDVTVALYNDAACTDAFTADWLIASIDVDKNITYTVAENTTYAERKAYIQLTAPETTGATDPDVVVIPVTQAGKDKVFASLAELVAADLTAGDEVTVTLNNDVIKEFYIYNSNRAGVVFDVQKDGKDIKIYFNNQTTIVDWAVGGKLSGTLTNVKWTTYSSAWQLVPDYNTWAWANLTYTEPKAVSTVVVSGAPTKTTYVDGEAFDPAGLTVTVNYNDATTEVNPTGVTFTVTPATLTKGATTVSVTATFNSVSSAAYEVTGLTVNDIPTKTVAEFIAAGGTRCYLEGIVSGLTEGNSMKYGNFDLTDANATIYVYGCLNASGEKEKFAELGVKNGDKIKVIADEYELYGGTKDEAKNVQYVSHISAASITVENITMEVEEVATISATLDPADAVVTYTIKENTANAISLSDNTITALAEGTATITATVAEGATYLGNSVDFTVTVSPKAEKVVILAQLEGQWYAMTGAYVTDKTNVLAAIPVEYFNGTLYNVEEADKASIEWQRSMNGNKATFKNGDKYLTGGTSTDLTLKADAFEWDYNGVNYLCNDGKRTFLYCENMKNNVFGFKNFAISNAGSVKNNSDGTTESYSSFPTVTAPVYATGNPVYTRTVTNKYGTICLPYASASTSGAYFYEVVGKGTENGKPAVYLASVDALEAGVPYIFEKTANTITVTCQGEAIAEAGSANGLIGTFEEITVPNDAYILYRGAFCTNNDETKPNKINAYRAYLDLSAVNGGAPQQMPGRRYIGMDVQGENGTTGLDNIITTDAPVKVIENGQLIIIRDGVKYNVQGQKL